MSDYTEPTQDEFDSAETTVLDVMSTHCPGTMTKTGSVVRELVIRPMSYLYAWAKTNLDALRKATSVSYLQTSTATENDIADDVASNYFVTRNTGTRSSGIVTLTMTRATSYIPAGASFTADGAQLVTETPCVLSTGVVSDRKDGVNYITVMSTMSSTGSIAYMASIPVVAANAGNVEIAAGTSVTVDFGASYITEAELTSSVTGGTDTETDAEMMERCRTSTAASGIGSYNGLRRKLDKAPVNVLSMSVVAGDDKPLFRARYNNTNINPGGFVDCYVKTQKQLSTVCVDIDLTDEAVTKTTLSSGATQYTFQIPSGEHDGFTAVTRLYTGKSGSIGSFQVEFGSSDSMTDADGARLSTSQTASVTFVSLYSDEETAQVYVDYMPGVAEVQDYMDAPSNQFIGQDVRVKSAVAVPVSMQCCVSSSDVLSESELALLYSTITTYVNELPVGTGTINFSDLRSVCSSAIPKADLRLPCEFTATVYLKDGSRDVQSSSTGVLDITCPASTAFWDSTQTFFCTTESAIRIEQA